MIIFINSDKEKLNNLTTYSDKNTTVSAAIIAREHRPLRLINLLLLDSNQTMREKYGVDYRIPRARDDDLAPPLAGRGGKIFSIGWGRPI